MLSEKPDPAPFRGPRDRRHRSAGCPGLVRFSPRDACRGGQIHAGALRHHEPGGSHGSSAGGLQPLPGHPALPPQGAARFLSDDEIRCLSATLSAHADTSPEQVAVVRLLC